MRHYSTKKKEGENVHSTICWEHFSFNLLAIPNACEKNQMQPKVIEEKSKKRTRCNKHKGRYLKGNMINQIQISGPFTYYKNKRGKFGSSKKFCRLKY